MRKWTCLQRKLTGLKSHKATASNTLRPAQSFETVIANNEPNKEEEPTTNPTPIHGQENEDLSSQAAATPEYYNDNHLRVKAQEMSDYASMPQTPYEVREPYDYYDSEEEGEEVHINEDNYDNPEEHDQTLMSPPRTSSLIASPAVRSPYPLGHRRESSTSSAASSFKPDFPTIKEEVNEEELPTLGPQYWPKDRDINIIVTNNATGDIFLPNLMEDLLSPSPEADSRLESNEENTVYYQTADVSPWSSQSHCSSSLQASRPAHSHHSISTYRTSEISSLGSGPRFFPSLSSHREETDFIINASSEPTPDGSVTQGRPVSCASTISEILENYSPRSPRNQPNFNSPTTNDHPDSPALASSILLHPSPLRPRHTSIKRLSNAAESSHSSGLSRRDVMADEIRLPTPEPVCGRSRLSITGRTCLGEWEWEDKYERWMRGEADADPWSEGEEDEGTFMLKPVAFEGFGKGRGMRRPRSRDRVPVNNDISRVVTTLAEQKLISATTHLKSLAGVKANGILKCHFQLIRQSLPRAKHINTSIITFLYLGCYVQ